MGSVGQARPGGVNVEVRREIVGPEPLNMRTVRQGNRRALLELLLRAGPLYQVELAERSGLTQQGVSKVAAELIDDGLVVVERQPAAGVGKPRSTLRLRPDSRCALGVHLDRDGVHLVRIDATGRVEASLSLVLPTGHQPMQAVDSIDTGVRQLLAGVAQNRVVGLGVGTVGPVDHRDGTVHHATGMPGWEDVPLREMLARRLGLDVAVDKNTNAAAVAHTWPGTTRVSGAILVGTGIGAGLVIDGRIYRGPRSGAGEFGHTVLDFRGPPCACGRRGCLEVLHRMESSVDTRATLLGIAVRDLVQVLDIEQVLLFGRAVDQHPHVYRAGVEHALTSAGRTSATEVRVCMNGERAIARGAALQVLLGHLETL